MTTQEAIETVRDVEGAIAFGPYSRALDATSSVLRVDGKHPVDEAYPSFVILALIYKEGRLTPDAEAFLSFARSARADALMKNWGGIPVRDSGGRTTLSR
jgi:phosphate transport system substrate-binding protein